MLVDLMEMRKRYIGNFENTTGYDVGHIYLTIHFYDEKDKGVFIVVEPEGIWKNGTKKVLNSQFTIQIRSSNTLRFFLGKKVSDLIEKVIL